VLHSILETSWHWSFNPRLLYYVGKFYHNLRYNWFLFLVLIIIFYYCYYLFYFIGIVCILIDLPVKIPSAGKCRLFTRLLNRHVKSGLCHLVEVKDSFCFFSLSFAICSIVVTYTSAYFVITIIFISLSSVEQTFLYSVDKKNQLDVTYCILYFSSNSCSTCFGQPCAHHQELTIAWCYSLVLVCALTICGSI
jgi:hypothetical protein